MSQTPSSSDGCSDQNDAPFQYPNPFRTNENNPAIARSWPDPNLVFAQQQLSPFYPYFPHTPPPPQRMQVPNAVDNSSTSCSRNSAGIPDRGASSTANNTCDTNGAKSAAKWGEGQTSEWKERIEEVESARATETWKKIVEEVNKSGDPKTVKQCKDKIRNLKKKYKEAKANNNKTGRPPQSSPFYDSFDEVLGTRAVVIMPGVIQSGQARSEDSPSSSQDLSVVSDESDQESESDAIGESDSESSPNSAERRAKRKRSNKEKTNKKAKKGRVTTASAMIDLTEKLMEMQNSQMRMMERSQKRAEDLLLKLEADQRKLDEEARARDQEFFLRMAEIMKK